MSKPPNGPSKEQTGREEMSFELALKGLEEIVEAMESEDLPLESLLAKYEQGKQLHEICQKKLADAELKIQRLEKSSGGELTIKTVAVSEETIEDAGKY